MHSFNGWCSHSFSREILFIVFEVSGFSHNNNNTNIIIIIIIIILIIVLIIMIMKNKIMIIIIIITLKMTIMKITIIITIIDNNKTNKSGDIENYNTATTSKNKNNETTI